MISKKNLVLKKSALSILVFTASTLITLGLAYFILQNTKLEKDIAKDYFTTVGNLDELEDNVKITQEIGLVPEFTNLLEENVGVNEDTLETGPLSYPASYPDDSSQQIITERYTASEIRSYLAGKAFTFELVNENQENGNKVKSTKEYFGLLLDQLESYTPPSQIEKDVGNLIPALKEYNTILGKYDHVFSYLGRVNDLYVGNVKTPGQIDYDTFLNSITNLETPNEAIEYREYLVEDFELLKEITIPSTPASYPSESEENDGKEVKIDIILKSSKDNYGIINFLSPDDREVIERASGKINSSMKKITEYKEKEIPGDSTTK